MNGVEKGPVGILFESQKCPVCSQPEEKKEEEPK